MYSDVTCIRGSGKKKNRDFGYAARKSRMDNYYHKEARAKTERKRSGRRSEREGERERDSAGLQGTGSEAEEKGVGCEHVDLSQRWFKDQYTCTFSLLVRAVESAFLFPSLSLPHRLRTLFFSLILSISFSPSFALLTPNTNARLSTRPTILSPWPASAKRRARYKCLYTREWR